MSGPSAKPPGAPANSELRAKFLEQRKSFVEHPSSMASLSELSQQIVDAFWRDCGITDWTGRTVALYRAMPGELDLRPIESRLAQAGARLCFPAITDLAAGAMTFVALQAPNSAAQWTRGPFGIEQPARGQPSVDPTAIDVIFVPGVAFGEAGERLGMGKGFYDRYLSRCPGALRVALAFDFQLLPALQQETWDQRMHWIWTERRRIQLRAWKPG